MCDSSQTVYVSPHLPCFSDHDGSPGYWASLSPSNVAKGSQESWRRCPLSCTGKPFFWLQMECRRIPVATDTFKDSRPGGRWRPGRMVRSSWQVAKTPWDRPEPSLPSTRRVGRSQMNSKQLVTGTLEDWEISGPGQPTVPTTSHPCWALAWKREGNHVLVH